MLASLPSRILRIVTGILPRRSAQRGAEHERGLAPELRLSERRARTIIESFASMTWWYRPATGHAVCRPRWHEYTGDTVERVRAYGWSHAIHEEDRAAIERDIVELLEKGKPFRLDFRVRRHDGEYRHIGARGAPLFDAAGDIDEWVGVMVDVTDRKLLEREFAAAHKMEAIGTLASGIAHDFNNLLQVIRGSTEHVLAGDGVDEAARKQLLTVVAAADRAAGLTRQLLDYGRKGLTRPQPLGPNATIRELEQMLRRIIGEDIRIDLDLDARVGNVRIDPAQFTQILMNLCANARDAMPMGGRLRIATRHVHRSLGHEALATDGVMLEVSDTGVGMAQEVVARVFDPFFSTKSRDKGSGLGLSVVQGIVVQAGGSIELYSQPGNGARFEIHLPATPTVVAAGSVVAPRVAELAPRGATILVVDDEPVVRELVATMLRDFGHEVMIAEDAAAALRIVETWGDALDLLLSDIVMPGDSGIVLAQQVRLLRPALPLMLMTGYADELPWQIDGLRDIDVVRKPFAYEDLRARVTAALAANSRTNRLRR